MKIDSDGKIGEKTKTGKTKLTPPWRGRVKTLQVEEN